jgi:hypothetical protein
MGKLMIIGVSMVGAVAIFAAGRTTAPSEGAIVVAARTLIEAQKKVPSCADMIGAVLNATAGDMR